jgi:tetratricopeptide (TPR) repeat protein
MADQFRYRAFISYSHADERWAKWLHRGLETYKVPPRLVGTETAFGPVPEKFAPVFRDREELATSTSLGDTLTRALEQSAFQIVICSMAAARSHWVNEEILTYKRLGREHRIFCLIVDGEPNMASVPGREQEECFPQALRFVMGPDGQLTDQPSEPIAADVRPHKDSKADAKLKLIAGMLGVGLDDLKQREIQRRNRRLAMLAAGSLAGMTLTSFLAVAAWVARNDAQRERARAEAEAETARQTTNFMVDLFKVSDPSEALGNSITAREILDKGAARISNELTDQPVIQATLMDTMGTVYTSLGLYHEAIPLMRHALDKRITMLGPENPEVAQSLVHLGEVLTLDADYDEAEKRLRESLEIRRKTLGPKDPAIATTLTALADVITRQGEYDKAEPLIREALSIRQSLYKGANADIAESIEDLGLNYAQRGDFEQAVVQLREALAMRRELHGAVHPALAEAINNLAWALTELDQLDEAEPLYRESVAMLRKLLGDAHPELANGLNNLAFVLQARGDLKGAEPVFREALAMNRKLLGDSHPEIATNMSNLAFVLYAQGKHEQAIGIQRASLEMNRKELGPEHPDVARDAANLAYWLIDEGAYEESGRLLEESLAIRRKALGDSHPQVAGTLTVKANLLLAMGHFKEARQVAAEARAIAAASLPPDHWLVALATNTEGAALAAQGQFAAAEPMLLSSLDGLASAPIPGLPQRARARVAELYTAWGKPGLARKYLNN